MSQRQWIDCEANAVLENLRLDVRVRSKDQAGHRAENSDCGEDDGNGNNYNNYDYNDKGEVEEGEGENEDEGGPGVIASGAAVASELGLNVDVTNNEEGEVPPFIDDDTMENPNEENEEDQKEGENEDGGSGRVIAAEAGVAPELGLDVDETDNEAGQVPPFPHDETVENLNQDAEETETGNQAKDEDVVVDGGEQVVQDQDPVAPPRSYTCGRCSKGIDLDSMFYRCVGHSCHGTFMRQSWIF